MTDKRIDMARVAELARTVNLDSVCWREVSAKRFIEQSQIPPELSLNGRATASGLRDFAAKQIVVLAEFGFLATGPDSPDRVVEIEGCLALRYSLTEGDVEHVSEDLVQDFARTNGMYNAWPYWRELAQTTATRVGIHGLIAPVFRLVDNVSKGETPATHRRSEESPRTA